MAQDQDLRAWAAREGLPATVMAVLEVQRFTSIGDIRQNLTPGRVTEVFQKPGLLSSTDCQQLRKAIMHLTGGSRRSRHEGQQVDRSHEDFPPGQNPPLLGCDEGDPLLRTQPLAGHVRNSRAMFENPEPEKAKPKTTQPVPRKRVTAKDRISRTDSANDAAPRKPARSFLRPGGAEARGENIIRFLLVGKCGSGKSTTGNTILGKDLFSADLNFNSVTSKCELHRIQKGTETIVIMDCPGLYDIGRSQENISISIVQAVACMHPGPDAILYIVRVGRFSPDEFGTFNRLKAIFDQNITKYIIVLFTGGDEMERRQKTMTDMLKDAPDELLRVLEECGHRYIVFNNHGQEGEKKAQVKALLDITRRMKEANREPYCCSSYSFIGQSLEAEVERRLEDARKKENEREKYIRELEAKARKAEEDVARLKRQFREKELELKRRQQEEDRRRRNEDDELERLRRRQKQEFKQRIAVDREKREELIRQLKCQYEREFQEIKQRELERLELEEAKEAKEKEEKERRKRVYSQQLQRTQVEIAKGQQENWLKRAAGRMANAFF